MKQRLWKLTAAIVAAMGWTTQVSVAFATEQALCESVAAMADAGTIEYHWGDRIDINNDGKLETIQFVGDYVSDYALYKNENGEELPIGGAIWDVNAGAYWYHFEMNGKTYRTQCRDPGCWAPSRLLFTDSSNATTAVCHFRQQYQEVVRSGPALCHSLIGDNTAKYASGTPLRPEDDSRRMQFLYPRERVQVDFDNDGKLDDLIQMEISNSSRQPCGYVYYDLLKPDDGTEEYARKRGLLLKLQKISSPGEAPDPIGRCHGNDAGWLEIDGAILFESKYRGSQPDVRSQFHDVMKLSQEGAVESVCHYTVSQKTRVVNQWGEE